MVYLVGQLGAGKTSLMRVIGGALTPDSGEVIRSQGTVVSDLAQEVPDDLQGSVLDVICRRLGPIGEQLAAYRHLCQRNDAVGGRDAATQNQLLALQQAIDHQDGWRIQRQAEQIISQMNLPPEGEVSRFSAGKRRIFKSW